VPLLGRAWPLIADGMRPMCGRLPRESLNDELVPLADERMVDGRSSSVLFDELNRFVNVQDLLDAFVEGPRAGRCSAAEIAEDSIQNGSAVALDPADMMLVSS
jgi:hypothetical protein